MWQLQSFELKASTFNLSEIGQAPFGVLQLWANGQRISNAIHLVAWEAEIFQLEICSCGVHGCADGGWASLRRSGDWVLLIPDFEAIVSPPTPGYYNPPPYLLSDRGAAYWHISDYRRWREDLAIYNAELPGPQAIAPLTTKEALRLWQLEAPAQILGHCPGLPQLHQDSIVAASEGSHLELLPKLQRLLSDWEKRDRLVTMTPIESRDQVIQLYVDAAGFPEWSVLADGEQLLLKPNFAIAML